MGWSGDINVFSRTATYISAAGQFIRRRMFAMRDVQTAGGKFADVAPVGGGFGGIGEAHSGLVSWRHMDYGGGAARRHFLGDGSVGVETK